MHWKSIEDFWRPLKSSLNTYTTKFNNESIDCTTTDCDKVEYVPVVLVKILLLFKK